MLLLTASPTPPDAVDAANPLRIVWDPYKLR